MRLQLEPINLKEANDFVENYHRHSKRTSNDGGKFALSAIIGDLGIVAVAIVGRPVSRLLQDGYTLEVLRLCVRPEAPRNTCSWLYTRCWRVSQALGYRKLITYTLATESGASLRGAGWKVVGQTKGNNNGWQNRPNRAFQVIYGQDKFRWEIS